LNLLSILLLSSRKMHSEEPSLLDHLKECRGKLFKEGGVSFVIYVGTIKNESDMTEVLSAHRKVTIQVLYNNNRQ
jgi:hypothetical protein